MCDLAKVPYLCPSKRTVVPRSPVKKEAAVKQESPRTPPKIEIEIEGEITEPTVKVEIKIEERVQMNEAGEVVVKAETDTVTYIKNESPGC